MAIQAIADGQSWTAWEYIPAHHSWVSKTVRAGDALIDLCNRFPHLVPGRDEADTLSAYLGSQWVQDLSMISSTGRVSTPLLLKAYKTWFADVASGWQTLAYTTVNAYTSHSVDRMRSSGLGRFRGAAPSAVESQGAAGTYNIAVTGAEDVMIQILPSTAAVQRGQTSTAPARIEFFFLHRPNSALEHATAVDGAVVWVAARLFTKYILNSRHVCDDVSGERVFTLSKTLLVYPISCIIGHVHMPHWCFFSGGAPNACHITAGVGIQHVARDGFERYLYNTHAQYPHSMR